MVKVLGVQKIGTGLRSLGSKVGWSWVGTEAASRGQKKAGAKGPVVKAKSSMTRTPCFSQSGSNTL